MNVNQKLESARDSIMQVIGTSELPVGAVYYMLKDVIRDIEDIYNTSLNQPIENTEEETEIETEDAN